MGQDREKNEAEAGAPPAALSPAQPTPGQSRAAFSTRESCCRSRDCLC